MYSEEEGESEGEANTLFDEIPGDAAFDPPGAVDLDRPGTLFDETPLFDDANEQNPLFDATEEQNPLYDEENSLYDEDGESETEPNRNSGKVTPGSTGSTPPLLVASTNVRATRTWYPLGTGSVLFENVALDKVASFPGLQHCSWESSLQSGRACTRKRGKGPTQYFFAGVRQYIPRSKWLCIVWNAKGGAQIIEARDLVPCREINPAWPYPAMMVSAILQAVECYIQGLVLAVSKAGFGSLRDGVDDPGDGLDDSGSISSGGRIHHARAAKVYLFFVVSYSLLCFLLDKWHQVGFPADCQGQGQWQEGQGQG
jgi:hypothetical protein